MSANVRATTFGYGPESPSVYDYFNKAASGASFLTITTAHVLDVIEAVLGNVTEVDARTELLWPEVKLTDTGETSVREIPDHVDIIAKTAIGAPVSVQVLAGVPESEANFVMEIRGSKGSLTLRGNHMAGVQVGDLTLSASVAFAPPETPIALGAINASAASVWAGAAINVGEVYDSLARDMAEGTFNTPGFAHAVHNSRLIAAVERAAQTGRRQATGDES
jgi:predicted dehydrogenase